MNQVQAQKVVIQITRKVRKPFQKEATKLRRLLIPKITTVTLQIVKKSMI